MTIRCGNVLSFFPEWPERQDLYLPLYFLTFQIFDNVTAEFHVKKDDFDSVTENTIGLLTYKKYRKQYYYIDFSINS